MRQPQIHKVFRPGQSGTGLAARFERATFSALGRGCPTGGPALPRGTDHINGLSGSHVKKVRSAPQNLVGPGLFTFILDREIYKATRLQYPVSILCLSPDLAPPAATASFLERLATQAVTQMRATDLASKLGSNIALLLIDAETRDLPGILKRLMEDLELTPGLTLSAGGGSYPETATSGSALIWQAVELVGGAKAKGGNQLHLPPYPSGSPSPYSSGQRQADSGGDLRRLRVGGLSSHWNSGP